MLRRRLLALAAGLCLAAIVFPARAQSQRSWRLESFDARLEVQPDGSLTVTETLRPSFVGSYNGIFRTIPVDYRTPEGFNYKLLVDLLSVIDDTGKDLRCETSREGHYIKYKIWIPGASDTTKTVLLTYRVENTIRYFDDHDELYWNATGTEWPVPIDSASAVIKLPPAASGPSLRATAYTGAYGSTASDADVEISGSQVSIRARHGLRYREGLTAVVGRRAWWRNRERLHSRGASCAPTGCSACLSSFSCSCSGSGTSAAKTRAFPSRSWCCTSRRKS
jgi:hypothetical protein